MDIKNKEVIFLELLAPAGDFECLKAAVQNGADSVYFGANSFSARAVANNFDNEALEKMCIIDSPIIGDGKYGNNQINKKFNQKTQLLCSYYIKFNFNSDAGVLNYLNGKEVKLDNISFI